MVTFLATHSKRGNVRAIGPVTGTRYLITPQGTPVSDYDVPGLLKVTGPPCCGETLPFGGQVKLFGKSMASSKQTEAIPQEVFNAAPKKKVKKVKESVKAMDLLTSEVSKKQED